MESLSSVSPDALALNGGDLVFLIFDVILKENITHEGMKNNRIVHPPPSSLMPVADLTQPVSAFPFTVNLPVQHHTPIGW